MSHEEKKVTSGNEKYVTYGKDYMRKERSHKEKKATLGEEINMRKRKSDEERKT